MLEIICTSLVTHVAIVAFDVSPIEDGIKADPTIERNVSECPTSVNFCNATMCSAFNRFDEGGRV